MAYASTRYAPDDLRQQRIRYQRTGIIVQLERLLQTGQSNGNSSISVLLPPPLPPRGTLADFTDIGGPST